MNYTRAQAEEILRQCELLEYSIDILKAKAQKALEPPELKLVEETERTN